MQPLQFEPIIRRIRWGGTQLGSLLGKQIGSATDAAESWEVVDHEIDQSRVTNGGLAGRILRELMTGHPTELLGRFAHLAQFPWLMKFLDAQDVLSVQVHPNDIQARRTSPKENGKTEAWVILQSRPGSKIYAGLKPGVTRRDLEAAVANQTVENTLHAFEPHAGDCLFIPAGTVHAIGAGIVLAEVQQPSNITYRLFDWGRVDASGKSRELHIAESLECIDFDRGPVAPRTPVVSKTAAGISELLVMCEYFVMRRHQVNSPMPISADNQCHMISVLAGAATLTAGGEQLSLGRGSTVVLPAASLPATIAPAGECTLLETTLELPA